MTELLYKINEVIINPLIILMIGVALIAFLFGLGQFLEQASSEEARSKGKRNMVFGLLGFLIMLGVFGIIKIILGTFGIDPPEGGFIP